MNKSILLAFAILIGLIFSSCKNSSKENKQADVEEKEAVVSDFAKQTDDEELADKVKTYINTQFLTDADLRAITKDQRKFQLYKIDLNNDGNEEVFVNFMTSYFCGTGGCTVLLLNSNLELITKFSPMRTLYVDETVENGWKVLLTETEGNWRKLVYEDGTYPSNPTMEESTNVMPSEQAEILFDEDFTKQKTYSF